jgi:hypothetical protein
VPFDNGYSLLAAVSQSSTDGRPPLTVRPRTPGVWLQPMLIGDTLGEQPPLVAPEAE